MSENKDRRSFDRMVIPETTATLIEKKWFGYIKNYLSLIVPANKAKNITIKDISKSGACLLCKHRHECGDPIHLLISIPGEKNLLIKGHVRWITKQEDQLQYCIGTQFYAYGSGRNFNSMAALEQLRMVHGREIISYEPVLPDHEDTF